MTVLSLESKEVILEPFGELKGHGVKGADIDGVLRWDF